MIKYVDNSSEIAISRDNIEQVPNLVKVLMDNGYVCMLSYEEDLVIINFIWASANWGECNRNDVVFMDRETHDCHFTLIDKDEDEDEF